MSQLGRIIDDTCWKMCQNKHFTTPLLEDVMGGVMRGTDKQSLNDPTCETRGFLLT